MSNEADLKCCEKSREEFEYASILDNVALANSMFKSMVENAVQDTDSFGFGQVRPSDQIPIHEHVNSFAINVRSNSQHLPLRWKAHVCD